MRGIRTICIGLAGIALLVVSAQAAQELNGTVTSVSKITPIVDQPAQEYHVMRAKTPPVIDGKADEWKDVPAIVLDRKEQSKGKWDGPDDLSGSLRMLWDEQALYFCLEVKDDVYHAVLPGPKKFPWDAEGWWANDGVQFAFDAYMNGPAANYAGGFPKGGYDVDELTFCVSAFSNGPVIASYRQRGDIRDTERVLPGFAIQISPGPDGLRIYEWAMPWSRLEPVSPWLLGRCGFSFALNDNDGKGFEGGIMWTPGVTFGQDAAKFGQIVFDNAIGSCGAMLPLHPEPKLLAVTNSSHWLNVDGVEPFDTARLIVRPVKSGMIDATLTVRRDGEANPVATGKIQHRFDAEAADMFVWDLSGLANGRYELAFNVAGADQIPEARLSYRQWSSRGIKELSSRQEELRKRYSLDIPWADMSGTPEIVQFHRGMVAAVLQWLDSVKARNNAGSSSGPEGREYFGEDRLKALSDGAEMIAALDAGENYLAKRRNEFWAAYYSPADGRGQPFVIRVPAQFEADQDYPLVVWLHGSNGRPAPDADYVHDQKCIEVRPWGRGDNSFTGLGEDDVFRVIEFVKKWYRIDPSRIYLTGRSMGGSGSWGIAARNPDVFAATAPICGVACELPLENLRNVPVLNQHGTSDWVLPLDYSRYAVSALRSMGYAVVHNEIPGWGHELTTAPPLYPVYDWLMAQRLDLHPQSITYTCDTPDRGRAYWLNIRQFTDPHRPARVDARLNGRGLQQSLTLRTQNAEVLDLDVGLMQLSGAILIQADNALFTVKDPLPPRLYLVRQGTDWAVTNQWSAESSEIRSYRAGAAADLYTGEPLLVVYGTAADTNRSAFLKQAAESVAGTAWSSHTVNGRFSVKADADVTADDLEHCNLVLIGGLKENRLTARMADKLPFRISEKNELAAGSREPVSLGGAGLRLAYYNPLNPKRLIFIVASDESGEVAGKWFSDARQLMTGMDGQNRGDQPDLVVQALAPSGDVVPIRRLMQFTHNWQWRELPGVAVRIPEAMANSKELQEAKLRVMRRFAGCDFALGYGRKPGEAEFDSWCFTLADMATASGPEQTLLCRMMGQELADISRRWYASNEVMILPAVEIGKVDTNRMYRVAMEPWLCGKLAKGYKRNLRDAEAGPDWRQEDLWSEVFGEEAVREAR